MRTDGQERGEVGSEEANEEDSGTAEGADGEGEGKGGEG